jgi:hypothetical protein
MKYILQQRVNRLKLHRFVLSVQWKQSGSSRQIQNRTNLPVGARHQPQQTKAKMIGSRHRSETGVSSQRVGGYGPIMQHLMSINLWNATSSTELSTKKNQ